MSEKPIPFLIPALEEMRIEAEKAVEEIRQEFGDEAIDAILLRERDLLLYGNAYQRARDDGTYERVDPADIHGL